MATAFVPKETAPGESRVALTVDGVKRLVAAGLAVTVEAGAGALSLVSDADYEKVGGQLAVLVDGGVRRGTDVLKALALGANAVLVGRPIFYGLSAAGAEGVQQMIGILRHELELAMALTGRATIAEIDRSVLWD